MKFSACWLFSAALILAPLPSETASAQQSLYDPGRYITDSRINEVHGAFQHLMRPDKSSISMLDAREIVTVGTFSAMAQSCDLPWAERVYLPMMARYRHTRKLDERHMKFIGVLHGFQQGTVLKALPAGACTPDIKEFLTDNIVGLKAR